VLAQTLDCHASLAMTDQRHCHALLAMTDQGIAKTQKVTGSPHFCHREQLAPKSSSRGAYPSFVIANSLPLICHREQLASNLSSRGACDVAIQQQSLRRGSPVFSSKNVKLLKFYFIYDVARNIKTKY
jgi:hypothetical protein